MELWLRDGTADGCNVDHGQIISGYSSTAGAALSDPAQATCIRALGLGDNAPTDWNLPRVPCNHFLKEAATMRWSRRRSIKDA